MFESTGSIDLVVSYLEALGMGSGARARRRALQLLNDYRARSPDGEVDTASLLRAAREQVLLTDSLVERSLPPEIPARMPPQTFRYGGRSGARDLSSQTGRHDEQDAIAATGGR